MTMSLGNNVALVCGNYVNAHTIVRNLRKVGFMGETVIVRHRADSELLAEHLNPEDKRWVLTDNQFLNFSEAVSERWCTEGRTVFLFLTSERFHRNIAKWLSAHPESGIVVHFGNPSLINTILDRFRFYKFIAERGLAAVPMTISGNEDPVATFGDAFVVRPRETWNSPYQGESVKIVQRREEFESVIQDFASRSLGPDALCFQELLSIQDEENVSVCGWFDVEHRHLYCLRKRIQHPPGAGNGVVCESIEAPEGVMEATVAILEALSYNGPLELEFVFDARRGEFKVIEMNPRFWMQHGLVEQMSGLSLVSRSLGLSPMTPKEPGESTRYWVNPLSALLRAVRFDFRAVGYYFRRNSWSPYPLHQALCYAPRHVLAKRRRGSG